MTAAPPPADAAPAAAPTTPPGPPAPRVLRLSTILTELSETHGPARRTDETPEPPDASADSAPGASPSPREKSDLSVGEIINRTQHAGFGFMLAFLALLSLPAVGMSMPFGIAIAFGAIQMMIGRHRPWLPAAVSRYQVSVRTLNWIGGKLTRWTQGLEKIIRPRFEFLALGPFWSLCGVCVLLHALALALPLPIPGTNAIFAIPILVYAIGLLESDGLLIMLCHAVTAIYIALAIAFSHVVIKALTEVWQWVAPMFGAA